MGTHHQPGDYRTAHTYATGGASGHCATWAGSAAPVGKPDSAYGVSGRAGTAQSQHQYRCPYCAPDPRYSSTANQPPLPLFRTGATPFRFLPGGGNVMKIRETFATAIQERIEPVVKVADRNPTVLLNELRNLVVTPQWAQYIHRMLEAHTDAFDRDDEQGIGIWISGFFGSGQSVLVNGVG